MARREGKSGRISVFKGREAKLNRAIFHILALKGPLAIYDIYKQIRKQKSLRHTKYSVVNRRVSRLEELYYVQKNGIRKTKAGFTVFLYELTIRGYLALILQRTSMDKFIHKADEAGVLSMVAAFALASETLTYGR